MAEQDPAPVSQEKRLAAYVDWQAQAARYAERNQSALAVEAVEVRVHFHSAGFTPFIRVKIRRGKLREVNGHPLCL